MQDVFLFEVGSLLGASPCAVVDCDGREKIEISTWPPSCEHATFNCGLHLCWRSEPPQSGLVAYLCCL